MAYKPIRNKIRRFTYDSLIAGLLDILQIQERSTRPEPFWRGLLLLKWTMEFAEDGRDLKTATRNDIAGLINSLETLELTHDTFNFKGSDNIKRAFTIISFQQLQYQQQAWWDSIARQQILFVELSHKYDIAAAFARMTGFEIDLFLRLLYIFLLIVFNENISGEKKAYLTVENAIEFIGDQYGEKTKHDILKLFSVSRESIAEVLAEDTRQIRNYDLQIFEPSFFTRKPIIKFRNRWVLPHRDVFNQTINHFIYDFMKNRDDQFSSEFGNRMEKYVRLGLDENSIPYVTENELRTQLGKEHNVVDFIADSQVLIEVKAVELKPYASINPTDELLANELRKTIVKAYASQIIPVANRIKKQGVEYFGIVITYKNLYLGNATDMWDRFLKDETEKTIIDPALLQVVPVENLFFMDLHTWDRLMQVIKTKKVKLVDILQKIRKTDSEPGTRKFIFDMHLDEYKIKTIDLSYLDKAKHVIERDVKKLK